MADRYDPRIGDVVLYNGKKVVKIGFEDREDMASMSYDRSYQFMDWEDILKISLISGPYGIFEYSKKIGFWVDIKGMDFPKFIRCEDVPPFELMKVEYIKVRQKVPKTVTVYE